MRILSKDQFLSMPSGTPFCYGERWCFSKLLIKQDSIIQGKHWGFWAIDPCWVEDPDSEYDTEVLNAMHIDGISSPMFLVADKYMDCDTDMNLFMVFEKADWTLLSDTVVFPDQTISKIDW